MCEWGMWKCGIVEMWECGHVGMREGVNVEMCECGNDMFGRLL